MDTDKWTTFGQLMVKRKAENSKDTAWKFEVNAEGLALLGDYSLEQMADANRRIAQYFLDQADRIESGQEPTHH